MISVGSICQFLESFAPQRLAADWDNVGLLVGDPSAIVERAMTCLTVTPESVAEAVEGGVNLMVTHHPFPFHPLRRVTTLTVEGKLLLDLSAARIAVCSPHTAFDSAANGINARLAGGLGLRQAVPLQADPLSADLGTGRIGETVDAAPLSTLARRLAGFLKIGGVQIVGDPLKPVRRVAVACGSAGDLLRTAADQGCDCFVTGETSFHNALFAQARGISLILAGHYASERFAVEALADTLSSEFGGLSIWSSRRERDPLAWISA